MLVSGRCAVLYNAVVELMLVSGQCAVLQNTVMVVLLLVSVLCALL